MDEMVKSTLKSARTSRVEGKPTDIIGEDARERKRRRGHGRRRKGRGGGKNRLGRSKGTIHYVKKGNCACFGK